NCRLNAKRCSFRQAQMAELVDALGSGPSGGNTVEVRVLFWAPPSSFPAQDSPHSISSNALIGAPASVTSRVAPSRPRVADCRRPRTVDGSTDCLLDTQRN